MVMTALSETASSDLGLILETHFKRFGDFGEETILVSYHGEPDTNTSDQLLKLSEKVLMESGAKRSQMKKVLTVLIEILQNVSLHTARFKGTESKAFYLLSHSNEYYNIYSGNLIFSDEVSGLKKRLDNLISLTPAEVKKMYIETLCNEDFSMKGGAGLGFLTIVKKVDEKIKYHFSAHDGRLEYFTLQAKIAK